KAIAYEGRWQVNARTARSTSFAGPPPPLRGGGSGRCAGRGLHGILPCAKHGGGGTTRRVVEGAFTNTDPPTINAIASPSWEGQRGCAVPHCHPGRIPVASTANQQVTR